MFEVKKYLINELPKLHDPTILSKKPVVVMVVGVNGTGKTTSVAKLAKMYKDMGNSVTLIAADTYRAAAVEQLKVWSKEQMLILYAMKIQMNLHQFFLMVFQFQKKIILI